MSANSALTAALASLNPEQRAAVDHGIDVEDSRAVLVIAGAGSGKTLTIATRLAQLVASGVDPASILLLTFTRRAAEEMVSRAGGLLGAGVTIPYCGTFHAVGARLLRENAVAIGLSPSFTILSQDDAVDTMDRARHLTGFVEPGRRSPSASTCLSIYSSSVSTGRELSEILEDSYPALLDRIDELRNLFRSYVDIKGQADALDFDDVLDFWGFTLNLPAVAKRLRRQFTHVLVDEFQDVNNVQEAIVRGLKPDGRGLFAVGDDGQSIYGFRGGDVRRILDFPTSFTPPARVIVLDRCYRCTAQILRVANAVLAGAEEKFAKTLSSTRKGARPRLVSVEDEGAQARFVGANVLERLERGIQLSDQVVLVRSGYQAAALELELTRLQIPYQLRGGKKLLDSAHVRDLLAVLRLARSLRDATAGYRVLRLIPGVGAATANAILEAAGPAPSLEDFRHAPVARAISNPLTALVDTLAKIGSEAWPDAATTALHWYKPILDGAYDDCATRVLDLEGLINATGAFPSLQAFLDAVALDPPESHRGVDIKNEDRLVISTVHSAKGTEFMAVTILSAVEGAIPSYRSSSVAEVDEERRIFYVAVTRARNELDLIVPGFAAGRSSERRVQSPSRFIPPKELFELISTWASRTSADTPKKCAGSVVSASRDRWKR